MTYVLLTEDAPRYRHNICNILDGRLGNHSHTFLSGDGCYQGVHEKSLLVVLVGDYPVEIIQDICYDIKKLNSQECVLLLTFHGKAEFV